MQSFVLYCIDFICRCCRSFFSFLICFLFVFFFAFNSIKKRWKTTRLSYLVKWITFWSTAELKLLHVQEKRKKTQARPQCTIVHLQVKVKHDTLNMMVYCEMHKCKMCNSHGANFRFAPNDQISDVHRRTQSTHFKFNHIHEQTRLNKRDLLTATMMKMPTKPLIVDETHQKKKKLHVRKDNDINNITNLQYITDHRHTKNSVQHSE